MKNEQVRKILSKLILQSFRLFTPKSIKTALKAKNVDGTLLDPKKYSQIATHVKFGVFQKYFLLKSYTGITFLYFSIHSRFGQENKLAQATFGINKELPKIKALR
jgi:hypothetical protein